MGFRNYFSARKKLPSLFTQRMYSTLTAYVSCFWCVLWKKLVLSILEYLNHGVSSIFIWNCVRAATLYGIFFSDLPIGSIILMSKISRIIDFSIAQKFQIKLGSFVEQTMSLFYHVLYWMELTERCTLFLQEILKERKTMSKCEIFSYHLFFKSF